MYSIQCILMEVRSMSKLAIAAIALMRPFRFPLTNGGDTDAAAKRRRGNEGGSCHARATAEARGIIPRAQRHKRQGLPNTGNSCFVNAVVQCLLAVPAFTSRLAKDLQRLVEGDVLSGRGRDVQNEKHESHLRMTLALLDLLQELSRDGDGEIVRSQSDRVSVLHPPGYEEEGSRSHSGRKRDHAVAMELSGSSQAVANQLRRFVAAASASTELVADPLTTDQVQQDAEELLLFILDSLHELLRSKHGDTPSERAQQLIELKLFDESETECLQYLKTCEVSESQTYMDAVSCLSDVRWQRYLTKNQSFITDVFTSQIVRGSQCCICAKMTCLHQEDRVLSLAISSSSDFQTIEECLEAHRTSEDLSEDNKVYCDLQCKIKTSRHTQVLIQKAPQILVIQLLRFKHLAGQASPKKIDTDVLFPISDHLDVTNNMFIRDANKPARYQLQAVCAHFGDTLDAGHYIAYTRDTEQANGSTTSQRWHKCNDEDVTTVDEGTLRSETLSTAYILFYTMVG